MLLQPMCQRGNSQPSGLLHKTTKGDFACPVVFYKVVPQGNPPAQWSLQTIATGETSPMTFYKQCQRSRSPMVFCKHNAICSKHYLFQFYAQCLWQQYFLKTICNPIYHFLNHSLHYLNPNNNRKSNTLKQFEYHLSFMLQFL
jgi:hypothetical protein